MGLYKDNGKGNGKCWNLLFKVKSLGLVGSNEAMMGRNGISKHDLIITTRH